MNCVERSERVRSLQAEVDAIVQWESLYPEEDVVGRQARAMRTTEILHELASIRREPAKA